MKPISDAAHSIPANVGVLGYIAELAKGGGMVHPDLSEHLYSLRKQAKGLALRKHECSEVLIGVESMIIHVAAFGTGYGLKVGEHLEEALEKGKAQKITWSDESCLDIPSVLGADWIVGSFDDDEAHWISV
jgi:hypothetical protein